MTEPQRRRPSETSVDIVIPVLNEAQVLEKSVAALRRFLAAQFNYAWRLVIVDNGSTDGTGEVAARLSAQFPDVSFLSLVQKGRGRALRHAWLQSKADVVCYMDADLSTDLSFLSSLVGAIAHEGYDIAAGSRLVEGSKIKRSLKREIISRVYNWFLRMVLATRFSDAQCGFKAASREVVDRMVPQVQDQSWFFDTELLVLAEKQGYRIKDLPIVWIDRDHSRVKILSTAWDDVKGILRLRKLLRRGVLGKAQPVPAGRREP